MIRDSLLESLDTGFVPYCQNILCCTASLLDPRFKASHLSQEMLNQTRIFINEKIQRFNQEVSGGPPELEIEVPAVKACWDYLEINKNPTPTVGGELESHLVDAKEQRSRDPLDYWKNNKVS